MTNRATGILACSLAFAAACSTDSTSTSNPGDGGATGGSSGASSGGASGGSSGKGGSSGAATGGSSGTATGGSSGSAGSCPVCKGGELCVEHETQGGALFLADAGRCPDGRVPVQSGSRTICETAPSFGCETLPAQCANPPGTPALAHCTCARSLCGSANLCADVSPTLMKCTLQAP